MDWDRNRDTLNVLRGDESLLTAAGCLRFFAGIMVVFAAVTVVLFIIGVPWWLAVVPVIAPAGVLLAGAGVLALTEWLNDHQRRAAGVRHDRAIGQKTDSEP